MSDDQQLAARRQQQAEHRAIVQATMQAKRSGMLHVKPRKGSEFLTAVVVIVVVIGMLVLVMRQGG